MALRVRVHVEGLREVQRACRALPTEAKQVLRDGSGELAEQLAVQIRAAGQADSRQSARAAASVKARKGLAPTITAGGTKRASAVLFGSEFGATRRFGWYARGRYHDSVGRQFRPHRGAQSYWFFRTVEREQGLIAAQYVAMADRVIREWGA